MKITTLIVIFILKTSLLKAADNTDTIVVEDKRVVTGYGFTVGIDIYQIKELNTFTSLNFLDSKGFTNPIFTKSIQLLGGIEDLYFFYEFKCSKQSTKSEREIVEFKNLGFSINFAKQILSKNRFSLCPTLGINANKFSFAGSKILDTSFIYSANSVIASRNQFNIETRNFSMGIGIICSIDLDQIIHSNNKRTLGIWPSYQIGLNRSDWYINKHNLINGMPKGLSTYASIKAFMRIF